MQVYSYVTHNCSETIFKTGLKEITGMIQRSCLLTNLLGWHARKVEESRDRSCSDWGREGSRALPENGAQKHPFVLGFPGTPYKDAVLLTVTSRSEVSRSGAPASLISSLLICCCPARKVHKTMCLCLFLLQDELVPLLYQLSVFVEPKAMGSTPDSACGWLGNVCVTLSFHWSLLVPDFFVYYYYLFGLCPALGEAKCSLSRMLQKHFSSEWSIHYIVFPCPTQGGDVQLQVCRIQRHLRYFSHLGYCWDERVRGLAAHPSVRIDNAWVRLFLCPVFCGCLTDQSNILPAAPLACIRAKLHSLTKGLCSSVFRHIPALDESEELQESPSTLTRTTLCKTSIHWGSPSKYWWERKGLSNSGLRYGFLYVQQS